MAGEMTDVSVNTGEMILTVKALKIAFGGLDRVLSSIAKTMEEAFSVKGFRDYQKTVSRFGKELANDLLVLQLAFGKMKYALAEAVAPLVSLFVPMLNDAIFAVIRFSSVVNQFFRGIAAAVTGNQNLTGSAKEAAASQETLAASVQKTGKAVRRSLANFDQLQRLNGPTGSGGSGGQEEILPEFTQDEISPKIQEIVDKVVAMVTRIKTAIEAMLAPLIAIDLTPLLAALEPVGQSLLATFSMAGEYVSFFWFEILTPFTAWVLENLAPAFLEVVPFALKAVRMALDPVIQGIQILWDAMKPWVEFIGQAVLTALGNWKQRFVDLAWVFYENQPIVRGIFENLSQALQGAWRVVGPILSELQSHFKTVFDAIAGNVGTALGYILEMLYGITQFLSGVFTGSWETAWEGVKLFLKSAVNGVIALLNTLINALVGALNGVVRVANKLSFTVPAWVPTFGGRKFGVNLPYVNAPQIPYLARGAVLPAGKPFLAMVGDQRHGTNIEAPLSTIQEAVALVMEDQTQAILRGFSASVQVQREILQAVLGIHIGDDVIGQAVSRYQQKMAVVRGG